MPTRKQRKRKAKTFRHEFDYVVVDDEGNEVEVEPGELRARKDKETPKAKPKQAGRGGRTPREVPPPSWQRSLRRGLPMGALILIVFVFLFKNMPLGNRILVGVLYAVAFVPLTYWIDRMSYRMYLRRSGKQKPD